QMLALARLCGGLPLALRVAAARLTSRPHWRVEQLASRLEDMSQRLDELVYGPQNVRATIALSYRSLIPQAQCLFRRLALLDIPDFPFWVAAPLLDSDLGVAEDQLELLVDAQLVDVLRLPGEEPRYRLSELIRVYAHECLAHEETPAERADALRRTLSTWLFLAEEAHRREYGGDYTIIHGGAPRRPLPPDLVSWLLARPLDWLDRERLALMAAVAQAEAIGEDEICWDLALSCVTVFEARCCFDDWRVTSDIGLRAAVRGGNRRGEAAMLYSMGALALFQQNLDESAVHLTSARNLFEQISERHGYALALRNLAFLDRTRGHLDEALATYEQVLTVFDEVGDKAAAAHVLCSIGQIKLAWGRYAEAEEVGRRALVIARALGNHRLCAQALSLLGEKSLEQGEYDLAEEHFGEVTDIVRSTGDRLGEAYALHGTGRVQLRRGNHHMAEMSLRLGYALACASAEKLMIARLAFSLAEFHRASGEAAAATARANEALSTARAIGAAHLEAQISAFLDGASAFPEGIAAERERAGR
ncbi:tetratricopeptide repeat protein, partial [Nonomuraea sp. KM90]